MSGARFEIVRTDAGWHARFRAANGRLIWWTENYKRRASAVNAISTVSDEFGYRLPPTFVAGRVDLRHWVHRDAGWRIEVREVDER